MEPLNYTYRGVHLVSRNLEMEAQTLSFEVAACRTQPNKHVLSVWQHPTPSCADDDRRETFTHMAGWAVGPKMGRASCRRKRNYLFLFTHSYFHFK